MIGAKGEASLSLSLIGGMQVSVCALTLIRRGLDSGLVDCAQTGMFML